MCVAVSGRCFTSQFLEGKSANRGQCLHPCRRNYKIIDLSDSEKELKLVNNKVMSAKDLCALPFIEKLKKAGISSFKIEGRNRNPEYVKTVVSVYRKALDRKLSKEEIKLGIEELKKVYNRGFSSGFLFNTPTSDDFSYSESGEQKEIKEYIGRVEKYWGKVKTCMLRVHSGKLEVGDEIYIIGKELGVKRMKVKSMEIEHENVKEVKKGQEVGLYLGSIKVKKGDEVFLIKEK